jgi:YesN/AraC family two-component response regulator
MVAENGAAGLDSFLESPYEIDLVLTDVVMPVMDGVVMVTDQELPPQHPGRTDDGIFGAGY